MKMEALGSAFKGEAGAGRPSCPWEPSRVSSEEICGLSKERERGLAALQPILSIDRRRIGRSGS